MSWGALLRWLDSAAAWIDSGRRREMDVPVKARHRCLGSSGATTMALRAIICHSPNGIVASDVSSVFAATYNGGSKTEGEQVEEGWLSV